MAKPPSRSGSTFTSLPDELILLIYTELIQDLLRSGNMKSCRNDYINNYLQKAVDMRTHKIAVEAFSESSFFDNDFTLQLQLIGSRNYVHTQSLRTYDFGNINLERTFIARVANPFFKDEQRQMIANVYNQPTRKELFGCFPRTAFAQKTRRVEFRLRTEVWAHRYTEFGLREFVDVANKEWLQRFIREMRMILKCMPRLEEISIGRDPMRGNQGLARVLDERCRELVEGSRGLKLVPGRETVLAKPGWTGCYQSRCKNPRLHELVWVRKE